VIYLKLLIGNKIWTAGKALGDSPSFYKAGTLMGYSKCLKEANEKPWGFYIKVILGVLLI
jgi:hypothetical protein